MEALIFFLFVFLLILIIARLGSIGRDANSAERGSKTRPHKVDVPFTITVSYGKSDEDEGYATKSSVDPDEFWIPAGQTVNISGFDVSWGMIYVGQNLKSPSGQLDPALINPKLKVDRSNPDYAGSSFSYWPSYSSISPQARAAYLEWLFKGRRVPGTNIGYVFLFFYGLERRLLVDAKNSQKARDEASTIISEVEELLNVYGENYSFANYARGFLEYARIVFLPDSFKPNLFGFKKSWEFPLEVKLALAEYAEAGEPIPPKLAFTWAELDPQKYFRTPAQRCRDKFVELFEIRYREKYGDGIVVKPSKANIQIGYRPASSGLAGESIFRVLQKPDITSQSLPLGKIHAMADSCVEELDPYSRFIGRRPEEAKTLTALALLPKEILSITKNEEIQQLIDFLETNLPSEINHRIVKAKDLMSFFGFGSKEKLTKADSVTITQLLGKLGYGIVPDIRFDEGRISSEKSILIFRPDTEQQALSSKYYSVAMMLMNLAIAISASDNTINEAEKSLLESHLERMLQLSDYEKERLSAYLKWSFSTRPDLSGMKRRLVELHKNQRETIAEFLVRIAHADGVIHPEEVKALKKVYGLLALDAEQIYSDIHRIQTSQLDDLTLIVTEGDKKKGHLIPKQELEKKDVVLDEKAIKRTLQDTEKVQVILAEVFVDDDPAIMKPEKTANGILGLDGSHTELLKILLEKPKWTQDEFDLLCERCNVLPAGAIETINEGSFKKFNEILIEEGEEIEINIGLSKEIRN